MLEYCVGEALQCAYDTLSDLRSFLNEVIVHTFDCPFQSVMTLELQASNVLLALHQIAALSNLFSHASLWSRSIRHITNFNITDQIRSWRGTMRVVGEKSFPIHSARSIVMIEHELRRLLQCAIISTYRESHEKNNESDKTWTMLLVTTMPFWKGSERSVDSHNV